MTTIEYASARLTGWRRRVRWMPLLQSLLAWPFTAVGAIGAAGVIAYRFAIASVQTGYADVRDRYPGAG